MHEWRAVRLETEGAVMAETWRREKAQNKPEKLISLN
jgi:hypothetical protein